MTQLRITELREVLRQYAADMLCEDYEDLHAILDAYEAQRPRCAGEVPRDGEWVLAETRSGHMVVCRHTNAYYVDYVDGYGASRDVVRWWPLPKGGEE